jgi:sarcosine oxidase
VTHDVIVVGLGATGSAALYHLARRNIRAIGLERFEPGHERGSSHGRTRIIRHGYFEHPSYVPLVRRAATMWRDLERAAGRPLMTVTGIAEIGRPDSTLVAGTLAASREHNLPHDVVTAHELMRQYPAFRLPQDYVAVIQPDGGFVEAEAAIRAHLRLAAAAGAHIRTAERVVAIEQTGDHVRVRTDRSTHEASHVIVAAGAWTTALLPDVAVPLQVTRQVLLWVKPAQPELFRPGWFPVFMIESEHGIHYGFPLHDEGWLKIAKHHHAGEIVDPESVDRTVSTADEDTITGPLFRMLPGAAGPVMSAKTCLYTMAPDGDFVIGRVPGRERIVVASPCSGHGFKFAPVIGQALAELVLTGRTPADLSRFRLSRFAS